MAIIFIHSFKPHTYQPLEMEGLTILIRNTPFIIMPIITPCNLNKKHTCVITVKLIICFMSKTGLYGLLLTVYQLQRDCYVLLQNSNTGETLVSYFA